MSFSALSDPTRLGRRLAIIVPLSLLVSACLVTTHRGPGHPPDVAINEPVVASQSEPAANGTAEADSQLTSIAASHLLVQYQGATRAAASILRTKPEARKVAAQALERARAGEPFDALVAEYSDEPGAAERGGSLGRFTRHAMVEEFAAAAFALEVGEISDVVESPFGFHVIRREE